MKPGEVYSHRHRYGQVASLDGAEKTLTALTGRYELDLIMNAKEAVQQPKLDQLGISSLFETIVYIGYDTEYKPHPELFQQALRVSGASPDEALYVGDDFESDICGADAVRIDAVWVFDETLSTDDETLPVIQIGSIAELSSLLGT
ncbi:HAD-IA family hydrolase [Halocatena pleomorpha]|uniref:HAD family hydrolase n=1 Tax=Halocatena pleomorpha TaxID=1785090 RepID=A0A3P3RBU2_9EURY|nr:HAD-IA family hydrolase [Halocatena pleomorpha]RRJ29933.1 HAD family hydrolase [Halocatena pleomorpha]